MVNVYFIDYLNQKLKEFWENHYNRYRMMIFEYKVKVVDFNSRSINICLSKLIHKLIDF
jgi:hypothetical protein